MDKPRIGSLFSGVGGLDLGLHWAGFETAFFVEINPYCQKVLNKNFPGVPVYENIKEVDFSKTPQVDGIVGGFPCQPASVAGKRRGANDERWLWPEFARAIRAVRPKFVIIENVPGLLTVDGGRCFQEVLSDLAACGLDVEWTVFPAAALGAWHRRERLWIAAYAGSDRPQQPPATKPGELPLHVNGNSAVREHGRGAELYAAVGGGQTDPDSERQRLQRAEHEKPGFKFGSRTPCVCETVPYTEGTGCECGGSASGYPANAKREIPEPDNHCATFPDTNIFNDHGERYGTSQVQRERRKASEVCRPLSHADCVRLEKRQGFRSDQAEECATAPGSGGRRVFGESARRRLAEHYERNRAGIWATSAGIRRVGHGVSNRVDRIRGLGNAVVPQCSQFVGECLLEFLGVKP